MPGHFTNIILFDDSNREHLLPLVFTRPVSEIRLGILTIREKWEHFFSVKCSHYTQDYLQEKFPIHIEEENLLINGAITPNHSLVSEMRSLKRNEALVKDSVLLAVCLDRLTMAAFDRKLPDGCKPIQVQSHFLKISRLWQIFQSIGDELRSDFLLLTQGRKTMPLPATNRVIGEEQIFLEEGARVEFATLNATTGPIYIGKNAEIMEGAMIRGALALCEGARIKMGARVYGPTTIGPYSRAGGEVTNTVFLSHTNKVHDGYMGNSVVGDWCNIGAGSNTSNLKNNYALVKVWNYALGKEEETGLQFCGLFMGDYSRCGINTMFNTGTVVGVSSNIYGSGFPGSFIPSFSWGGASGFEAYRVGKAIETIESGLQRKQLMLSEADKEIINRVYNLTGRYRKGI
jgi:UDP-N-acetylglucosamine diphosphorylase/glucosamine-1-phosphate N-acetyltransferase